jgi:hypothetical protein
MLSYSIQNSNKLSNQLEELLAYDLEYIKSHNNPNYHWGNCTGNLSSKFRQYNELDLLPVFSELLSAGFDITDAVLFTLKTNSIKTIRNINYLGELTNASIIIPIGSIHSANYVWYNTTYITQHNIESLPMLHKEHGNTIIDGSCIIEKDTPVLVKHQNYWAAINNKQDSDFNFLQITLRGNPEYEEVKNYLGMYSGNNPGSGPKS